MPKHLNLILLGPIYGSGCLSKIMFRLNWYDSGWWGYQVDTINSILTGGQICNLQIKPTQNGPIFLRQVLDITHSKDTKRRQLYHEILLLFGHTRTTETTLWHCWNCVAKVGVSILQCKILTWRSAMCSIVRYQQYYNCVKWFPSKVAQTAPTQNTCIGVFIQILVIKILLRLQRMFIQIIRFKCACTIL